MFTTIAIPLKQAVKSYNDAQGELCVVTTARQL